jgi:hypothetical protein
MPNIGGKKFPYTPAGMDAARKEMMAMVPGQEDMAIDDAMSRAGTPKQRSRLRRIKKINSGVNESGNKRYGNVKV